MMNTYIADGTSALSSTAARSHGRNTYSTHKALVAAAFAVAGVAVVSISLAAAPLDPVASTAPNDALLTLELRCAQNDAVSCNDLGVGALRGSGDLPADINAAARAFERSCNAGSPDGCGNLGALYESGAGVPPDLDRAVSLYAHGCTLGCALACSNLGALYARGRGVERDLYEAQLLFSRACETGSAAGCSNLLELGTRR